MDDYYSVDCVLARESLSARIDGEREPAPAARVDEHLAGCGACRAWHAAAVAQTVQLRRLAGRSQLTAVPAPARVRGSAWAAVGWRRWALGAVGLAQVGLAVAQAMGAHLGVAHAAMMGHVLNESTAWSAALGVVMLAAAVRPAAAAGLAWVLAVFAAVLSVYVVRDAAVGAVTLDRVLTHLPVVIGAALAFVVWRSDYRRGPGGDDDVAAAPVAAVPSAGPARRRPGSAA